MKKKILLIVLIGISFGIKAQNTFPTNGNVGIGTITPQSSVKLDVRQPNANSVAIAGYAYDGTGVSKGVVGHGYVLSGTGEGYGIYGLSTGSRTTGTNIGGYFMATGAANNYALITGTGNVGIGTNNPMVKLDIASNSFGLPATSGSTPNGFLRIGYTQRSWGGTEILSGIIDSGTFDYAGYIQAKNPIDYSHNRTFLINPQGGNVGIGTTNPNGWKLAVNGNIRAKEIKVETGWSDFVFENDYKLPTLQEVENHIKEKGHLKDIPSAKEVEKNGIFLGEMDSKLLQKIEELTLYTIQQEKKIKEQAEKIENLESLNKKLLDLQKRLEKLEQK